MCPAKNEEFCYDRKKKTKEWILEVKEQTMLYERYFYLSFMDGDTNSEPEMTWSRSCSRQVWAFSRYYTTLLPQGFGLHEEDTCTHPCAGPHRGSVTGVTNSFLYSLSDGMLSTSHDHPRTLLVNYSYFGSVNKDQTVLDRQSCGAEKGSSRSRLGSQKRPSKEVS